MKKYLYNLLSLNIKLINPIQKYPHNIESYTCILKIFAITFLLPINFLISFGICSTPKESLEKTPLNLASFL